MPYKPREQKTFSSMLPWSAELMAAKGLGDEGHCMSPQCGDVLRKQCRGMGGGWWLVGGE